MRPLVRGMSMRSSTKWKNAAAIMRMSIQVGHQPQHARGQSARKYGIFSIFLDKAAHWRYNTTIFRMNEPGETAHAAPKGKAKSLRQKDRFGTKLWKAYSRTGEAIRPWRRIFRVNGQRHQTLAMAHEDFCPVRFLF